MQRFSQNLCLTFCQYLVRRRGNISDLQIVRLLLSITAGHLERYFVYIITRPREDFSKQTSLYTKMEVTLKHFWSLLFISCFIKLILPVIFFVNSGFETFRMDKYTDCIRYEVICFLFDLVKNPHCNALSRDLQTECVVTLHYISMSV